MGSGGESPGDPPTPLLLVVPSRMLSWGASRMGCSSLPATAAPPLLMSGSCVIQSPSRVRLSLTPCAVAHQAPLSMGFPRQGYWSGWPCPSPRHLLNPALNPGLRHCRHVLFHRAPRAVGPLLSQLGTGNGDWKAACFMFCIHISPPPKL